MAWKKCLLAVNCGCCLPPHHHLPLVIIVTMYSHCSQGKKNLQGILNVDIINIFVVPSPAIQSDSLILIVRSPSFWLRQGSCLQTLGRVFPLVNGSLNVGKLAPQIRPNTLLGRLDIF